MSFLGGLSLDKLIDRLIDHFNRHLTVETELDAETLVMTTVTRIQGREARRDETDLGPLVDAIAARVQR